MTDSEATYDHRFYELVVSLHAGAMQQMGKVASPMSGKVERNLQQAKHTIDIVDMLKKKMTGNLSEEESKLIDHIAYELHLNFVDESKKGDRPEGEQAEPEKPDPEPDSSESDSSADEKPEEQEQ